jgi:hypothetical protein
MNPEYTSDRRVGGLRAGLSPEKRKSLALPGIERQPLKPTARLG